jgi:hypothetical protein
MELRSRWMVLWALAMLVPGSGMAGEAWICSVASAVAVDEDGSIGPPDLGERERPTFLRVDPVRKELTLLAPASRRGEVTKLDSVHEVDGNWVLSGVENGRSVSMVITAEGRMTLSVVADGVIWSVFGHTLREGEPVEAATESAAEATEPAGEATEAAAKPAP